MSFLGPENGTDPDHVIIRAKPIARATCRLLRHRKTIGEQLRIYAVLNDDISARAQTALRQYSRWRDLRTPTNHSVERGVE